MPAFTRRARAALERRIITHPRVAAGLTRQFQRLYYYAAEVDSARTWRNTHWLGTPVLKCPLDLWVYQELLVADPPDLVIETGTNRGGSALYLATILDLVGRGEIVTIDTAEVPDRREHPRLTYVTASSTAPDTVAGLRERATGRQRVVVILDSDHRAAHVREELRLYADLVTPGSHLVVEDTNVNGHPAAPDFGPGPMEAVEDFLRADRRFTRDPSCERFLMTLNPGGFLRRTD